MNNILVRRGLVTHEQRWEDRKTVRTPRDEITVGTEHWRSDEWKEKGRVPRAKLKPDLVWLRRDAEGQWKKVEKAVMVPLIISHDGAVHKDTVRRWKNFASDVNVDWVRMAQNALRFNVVIVGKYFNEGSWVSDAWKRPLG